MSDGRVKKWTMLSYCYAPTAQSNSLYVSNLSPNSPPFCLTSCLTCPLCPSPGKLLFSVSFLVFLLMLILLGKGFTVTRWGSARFHQLMCLLYVCVCVFSLSLHVVVLLASPPTLSPPACPPQSVMPMSGVLETVSRSAGCDKMIHEPSPVFHSKCPLLLETLDLMSVHKVWRSSSDPLVSAWRAARSSQMDDDALFVNCKKAFTCDSTDV